MAVWNDNELIEHGQGKGIEDVICDILKIPGVIMDEFICCMHSRLFTGKHNSASVYNMLFGSKSPVSGEYMLYEYELAAEGSKLLCVNGGNALRAYAAPGYVPQNIKVDYGMDIDGMEKYCKDIVQTVIETGELYLKKGLIDYFTIERYRLFLIVYVYAHIWIDYKH